MNRKNQVHAFGQSPVFVTAAFVGGGDAADLTVAPDATVKGSGNAASTGARTGEGVYECVFAEGSVPQNVLQIIPHCEGAGHRAEITTPWVAATRKVVVTIRNSAGTADDLPTTDTLRLLLIGQDTSA